MSMANSAAIDFRAGAHCATVARALSIAALLTVCLAAAGCSGKSDTAPAAAANDKVRLTPEQRQNVSLFTVASAKFHRNTETTGVVDFDNDQATSVLAPFSGPVSRLLVGLGDRVRMGDPLALVDSPDFAEAISTYQKALATARTNRRLADLDKDLQEHNGVAQREAAQAETDAVNAEADRDAALQALISLNVNPQTIDDLRAGRPIRHATAVIRSPIAGTVVEKLITPGQLLSGGTTPCFTVANLSRVWVMAQVFGNDLSAVNPGDPAEVTSGIGSDTLPGKVDNISALVDPDTRAVAVRVVIDNPKQLLKKQMYVRVSIRSAAESDGLLVPVSAILRDDENLPFVYIAEADGSFARRHVSLGFRAGEQYDITDGLRVGDQIVVGGAIFVQFMQSQ
jgi:cobalt-zinc-cadmium efflux system membrane fusion protein